MPGEEIPRSPLRFVFVPAVRLLSLLLPAPWARAEEPPIVDVLSVLVHTSGV